jgi:thioredoxin reductase
MIDASLPVAVIGAGPVGLAAAAHLVARGETPLVLEAGDAIGHSVRQWAHVRMFSPWEYTVDRAAVTLLEEAGWQRPPRDALPTGGELVRHYLEPLASLPGLRPHIHLRSRVIGITRKGYDKVKTEGRISRPFSIVVLAADGQERRYEVKAVIDASGTWSTPNPAGADGLPAGIEDRANDRILYGIPDVLGALRGRYAGRTTLVIGSGHSALNALIDLAKLKEAEPATRIIWVTRKQRIDAAFGGEAADALPARGALGIEAHALVDSSVIETVSPFHVAGIERSPNGTLNVHGDAAKVATSIAAEQIIVATGFRPDFSFLREIRLSIDPWLESSGTIGPLIDPNLHSCGTVRPHGAQELAHPESNFYIAGMKSYGRAPTFLLATGHEQVRSIVADLVGDHAAARQVQLVLPKTGVCRTSSIAARTVEVEAGCCGGPPRTDAEACCARDEEAKIAGEAGCGCGSAGTAHREPAEMV